MYTFSQSTLYNDRTEHTQKHIHHRTLISAPGCQYSHSIANSLSRTHLGESITCNESKTKKERQKQTDRKVAFCLAILIRIHCRGSSICHSALSQRARVTEWESEQSRAEKFCRSGETEERKTHRELLSPQKTAFTRGLCTGKKEKVKEKLIGKREQDPRQQQQRAI